MVGLLAPEEFPLERVEFRLVESFVGPGVREPCCPLRLGRHAARLRLPLVHQCSPVRERHVHVAPAPVEGHGFEGVPVALDRDEPVGVAVVSEDVVRSHDVAAGEFQGLGHCRG